MARPLRLRNGHNRIVSDATVLCSPRRLDRVKRTVIQLLRGLAFSIITIG